MFLRFCNIGLDLYYKIVYNIKVEISRKSMKIKKNSRTSKIRSAIRSGIRQGIFFRPEEEKQILLSIQNQRCSKSILILRISKKIKIYELRPPVAGSTFVSFNSYSKRIVPLESSLFED